MLLFKLYFNCLDHAYATKPNPVTGLHGRSSQKVNPTLNGDVINVQSNQATDFHARSSHKVNSTLYCDVINSVIQQNMFMCADVSSKSTDVLSNNDCTLISNSLKTKSVHVIAEAVVNCAALSERIQELFVLQIHNEMASFRKRKHGNVSILCGT
jgi:hypothetical protein